MEHQTGPREPGTAGAPADGAAAAVPWAPPSGPEQSTSAPEDSADPLPSTAERGADPLPSTAERSAETVPSTGEARVDAALTLLSRLPELPVSEHAELFERVHAQLSDVLGELDSGPAGPAGG